VGRPRIGVGPGNKYVGKPLHGVGAVLMHTFPMTLLGGVEKSGRMRSEYIVEQEPKYEYLGRPIMR